MYLKYFVSIDYLKKVSIFFLIMIIRCYRSVSYTISVGRRSRFWVWWVYFFSTLTRQNVSGQWIKYNVSGTLVFLKNGTWEWVVCISENLIRSKSKLSSQWTSARFVPFRLHKNVKVLYWCFCLKWKLNELIF